MKSVLLAILTLATVFLLGCQEKSSGVSSAQAGNSEEMNADTKLIDVIHRKEFAPFRHLLISQGVKTLSADDRIRDLQKFYIWHTHLSDATTLDVLNELSARAKSSEKIFYEIYDDDRKLETGLFFFRGKKDAPFAVINAGGGFAYVGLLHESLPHALYLSRRGYNAFALQYRTGGAQVACEDLAAALSFIFRHADELGVDTKNYSLWGGSAGARMAAYLGSYGSENFGGDKLPRPGAVIMQYTGHSDWTREDPPTFVCVGELDGIASWRTMKNRVDTLANFGIATEFHKYPNLGHGFGLGLGTCADGWIDSAISFWERIRHD